MLYRVCLAVDDRLKARELNKLLTGKDLLVSAVKGGKRNLIRNLAQQNCDMFVVSLGLLPEPARDAISTLKELPENPVIILISDVGEPELEAAYLACGCDAVLSSGLPTEQITDAIVSIIAKRGEMQSELIRQSQNLSIPRLSDFASSSESMRACISLVQRVVKSDSSLLILGETGVGKERLARAIHAESHRSAGPFVTVNCAALPDNLLESELFGYDQGAFTGATRPRRGAFEMGHKGTVFLDEIGDIPLNLQVKLLRVLQDKEFMRLGGERTIAVDVRIMAATNRDLKEAVERKEFRSDLYFRLGVVSITIPPLSERRGDIPDMVSTYIAYLGTRIGTGVVDISKEALEALKSYDWPGNVRELRNVIERALLLCDGSQITTTDLPEEIAHKSVKSAAASQLSQEGVQLPPGFSREWFSQPWRKARRSAVEAAEKAYFATLLTEMKGRIGETAKKAGVDVRSIHQKMRRLGLDKKDFKNNQHHKG